MPDRILSHYELLEEIGKGGMAVVFDPSRLPPVRPHRPRRDMRGHTKPYEMFHAVALHNGYHRLTQG